MDRIYIEGGQPLRGVVEVGGSKNDALAIMGAALLVPGVSALHNIPRNSDVHTLLEIFRRLGAKSRFREDGALEIDATCLTTSETPHDLVRQMRASFNLLGVLIARCGHAAVAMPGGCDIGSRPVDFHIKGLEQLGCHLRLEHGIYIGEAKRLVGANIYFDFPSAGATQHLMIAACCAQGATVIENCAAEPEVADLADFLNACGARIYGAGTSTIVIDGVAELTPTEFTIIPDRLQAGTYAVAAAITGGDVTIRNAVYDHCRPVFSKLMDAGAEVIAEPNAVRVRRRGRTAACGHQNHAAPRFPDRYAASFRRHAFAGRRRFAGHGNGLRKPIPLHDRTGEKWARRFMSRIARRKSRGLRGCRARPFPAPTCAAARPCWSRVLRRTAKRSLTTCTI